MIESQVKKIHRASLQDNEPPKLDERDYRMLWEAVVQAGRSFLHRKTSLTLEHEDFLGFLGIPATVRSAALYVVPSHLSIIVVFLLHLVCILRDKIIQESALKLRGLVAQGCTPIQLYNCADSTQICQDCSVGVLCTVFVMMSDPFQK